MIKHNITYVIETQEFNSFLIFAEEFLIPEMLKHKTILEIEMISVEVEAHDAKSLCLQLKMKQNEEVIKFENEIYPRLRHEIYKKFSEKVLGFSTNLKVLQVFENK